MLSMPNKHILIFLFPLFLITFFSSSAPAADKSLSQSIAYIDIPSIIKAHPIQIKWETDIESLRIAREKEVMKAIEEKFSVKNEKNLTEQQKKEVQAFLVQENQKFIQEMTPQKDEIKAQIEKDILAVCTQLANEKGYAMVLDRSVVIIGGTDMTNDVIVRISSKYK